MRSFALGRPALLFERRDLGGQAIDFSLEKIAPPIDRRERGEEIGNRLGGETNVPIERRARLTISANASGMLILGGPPLPPLPSPCMLDLLDCRRPRLHCGPEPIQRLAFDVANARLTDAELGREILH